MLFSLLLQADITSVIERIATQSRTEMMQEAAMFHLIDLDRVIMDKPEIHSYKLLRSRGSHIHDPCTWEGVTCESGEVVEIWWQHMFYLRNRAFLDLRWIPSTVRVATLSHWIRTSPLDTRLLPRSANLVNLTNSRIHGTVDLEALPAGMETLLLVRNPLEGTLRLTHLPPKMTILDLFGCPIAAIVVDNERLPESLKVIRVERKYPWSLSITILDENPLDPRIRFDTNVREPLLG